MVVGRFLVMIGMLVWRRDDGRYLLLRRAANRDFAPGQWETGSGRLEQGEGFIDALQREAKEELGRAVRLECILGTTHFYRGDAVPENEMVGLSFGCSIPDATGLSVSAEHSEHRWVTADEAQALFPADHWLPALITRAEALRSLMPEELRRLHRESELEF